MLKLRMQPNFNRTGFPKTARKILARVDEPSEWTNQLVHVKQFADSHYLASYEASVASGVLGELPADASVVLDFGCWSGVTTAYLAGLTKCTAIGTDVDTKAIEFANRFIANAATRFVDCEPTKIPLNDESVDLVVVNQVFCNMRRNQYEAMLAELARVLVKGGKILLFDSNNPRNADVQERLKQLYREYESENGASFLQRQSVIDSLAPGSAPNVELTKATCYFDREAVEKAVRAVGAGFKLPNSSYFDPDCLEPPVSMNDWGSISRSTDPVLLCSELSKSGVAATSGPSYPPNGRLTDEAGFCIVGTKHSVASGEV